MRPLRVLSSKDLGEVNDFLDELQDGDKYKERFRALENQKKEINTLIEVWGKAKDIDRIRSNASTDENQARKTLENALAKRTSIDKEIVAAKVAADAYVKSSKQNADKMFVDREKAVIAGEQALGEREKALALDFDDLERRDHQVAIDMKGAIAIRTKYTEAVGSLKKAIENTAKAL